MVEWPIPTLYIEFGDFEKIGMYILKKVFLGGGGHGSPGHPTEGPGYYRTINYFFEAQFHF